VIRRVQRDDFPFSIPSTGAWSRAKREWLSIRTVRSDKNLVFTNGLVRAIDLFAETLSPHMPQIVRSGDELFVVSGETTLIQAVLTGKPGLDVLVLDR
jgi:hypothetical protein